MLIFSLLNEIEKEQYDGEAAILKINTGKTCLKRLTGNDQIQNAVTHYQEF